jgi:hypothetical protein
MLAPMSGSWAGSMTSALVATLGHPAWWAMALAAFLVRGGFVVILLPIVTAPSPAAIATAIAPTVDALAFGGLGPDRIALGLLAVFAILVAIAAAGLAGTWLDLALVREAAADEDLDVRWSARDVTPRRALGLRVAAHVATVLALLYGAVRLVLVTYDELLSPGDPALPLTIRVLGQLPDVVALVLVTWLFGEAVAGVATRHAAAGLPARGALRGAVRRVVSRRGLATLLLTNVLLVAVATPFLLGVGRAWEALRFALIERSEPVQLGGALLVLIAAWILGLLVLGAVLAWRSTAWTAQAVPRSAETALPEPAASPSTEAAAG